MKTTYLLREVQQDGSICLVETTSETWHSIVKEDAQLPRSQRRCFICDTIADGRDLDCMVMETTFEEWQAWDKEQRQTRRNHLLKKRYEHLSADALEDDEREHTLMNEIMRSEGFEIEAVGHLAVEELRKALVVWRPWGAMLLDYYIAGEHRTCTQELAKYCDVSEQVVRKYKRQFENFVADFFA